jgi:heme/copper-type cytochrome/quinol oxidase subunit 1
MVYVVVVPWPELLSTLVPAFLSKKLYTSKQIKSSKLYEKIKGMTT